MTAWVRSSFCASGDCIEVRELPDGRIGVQQRTRNPHVAVQLQVTRSEWDAFMAGVKNGDFDNLQETP